jgi:hypothetical protein
MRSSTSPTHNILFTLPRTGSNLLIRILNLPNQPSISSHSSDGYFFLPTQLYRYTHHLAGRPVSSWTSTQRTGMDFALSSSFTSWKGFVDEANNQGKSTYIKEHINWLTRPIIETAYIHDAEYASETCNPNLTCIPNAFFRDVRATFLIRHPALVVPSLVRVALKNEGRDEVMTDAAEKTMMWESTYTWHVEMYRFLGKTPSGDEEITFPIILDASDLADRMLVRKYAAAVGLDKDAVRFEWDVTGLKEGEMGMEERMKETLLKSEGLVLEKLARVEELDIEVLKGEWKEEFGVELGDRVARLVESAMGDYEWLWERRIKV